MAIVKLSEWHCKFAFHSGQIYCALLNQPMKKNNNYIPSPPWLMSWKRLINPKFVLSHNHWRVTQNLQILNRNLRVIWLQPYVTLILVRSFLTKPILSCLNMCTLDFHQMTLSMLKDSPLFWSLTLSSFVYPDLTHQMNYYIKLQFQYQLRKNPNLMIPTLGHLAPEMNIYTGPPFISLMENENTVWIPVDCQQLYFKHPKLSCTNVSHLAKGLSKLS